jgi:ferric-dicitrate binding protein FerR (iron transport regulator)
VNAERELSWATRWITIKDPVTISEAVEEFNRLNSTQIQIEQPDVARRPLSGYFRFRIDGQLAFARMIAATNDLEVTVDRSRNVILLRAKKPRDHFDLSSTERRSGHPSRRPHFSENCGRLACD